MQTEQKGSIPVHPAAGNKHRQKLGAGFFKFQIQLSGKKNMKNKGDIYVQGFVCLLQILSVLAIKLHILTEVFQS